jgi:hypothetical protein
MIRFLSVPNSKLGSTEDVEQALMTIEGCRRLAIPVSFCPSE